MKSLFIAFNIAGRFINTTVKATNAKLRKVAPLNSILRTPFKPLPSFAAIRNPSKSVGRLLDNDIRPVCAEIAKFGNSRITCIICPVVLK